jgi:hypothetical protein
VGEDVGVLKLRVEVLERDDQRLSAPKELRPQGQGATGQSKDVVELIAVARLRGLANVAVRDCSGDFTLIIGDHWHRGRSSVAQCLSPRISSFVRLMLLSRS